MRKSLFILLACLFVVMIGFGITLPVLTFYVERLALATGASRRVIVLHVTLLTSVYALMQLLVAPLWGRLSDRVGRRPLILLGISGFTVAQVAFGMATSLWLLYAARIVGGILTSATLPTSAAYVVDMTTKEQRARGMAWLGTATSLGVIVGPALGGVLSRRDWHFSATVGHLRIDGFSMPFFAAALLGALVLAAAWRWLPESLPSPAPQPAGRGASAQQPATWSTLVRLLAPLLAMTIAAQLALAMFEATFALFAQSKFAFGPTQVGYVFVACGLVMAVMQAGAVGFLAGRVSEMTQVSVGFGMMGIGITLLAIAQSTVLVFAFVALLSAGMAFITPNLSALVSQGGSARQAGTSLGIQNSASSLGQSIGPVLGGALFLWQRNAPYFLGGALLIVLGVAVGWRAFAGGRDVSIA